MQVNLKPRLLGANGEPAPYVDWRLPPMNNEDRLLRIRMLGDKIASYVRAIGAVGSIAGSSVEAQEKAVVDFHDRLVVAERQLARIHDAVQLA